MEVYKKLQGGLKMDNKMLEREILQCAENKRFKGRYIVSIPNGMDKIDAIYLFGSKRVELEYSSTPIVVVIHEGKYMVYAKKETIKNNQDYRKQFIDMSLRDQNEVTKIRILN